ncbi:hypothetical protein RMSM_00237 [Rhodopirellula maiorica SM1]|uniref:Uncharacterized protein n=1 Tax=Rhodopirellula maiorica SM1 TaxID=1265738 RepID=M5RU21_9BACT|nr:hypothetical protein RMSM_00237 [Rhodopirellula maiorica SM1]
MIEAIQNAPLPDLGDGSRSAGGDVSALEAQLRGGDIAGSINASSPLGTQLCSSGLWLLAGDLDRSHRISQDIDEKEGSFWHGIMHRREGDFSNAKYWFRRVGKHPVISQLSELCGNQFRSPEDFVDACAEATRAEANGAQANQAGSTPLYAQCQDVQWKEWQLLMAHCVVL